MARLRRKSNTTNNLLLPSVALSALVLVLVGILTMNMRASTPTNTSVSADTSASRTLTKGLEVDDLNADLMLLQQDNLDAELSILGQLR